MRALTIMAKLDEHSAVQARYGHNTACIILSETMRGANSQVLIDIPQFYFDHENECLCVNGSYYADDSAVFPLPEQKSKLYASNFYGGSAVLGGLTSTFATMRAVRMLRLRLRLYRLLTW